MIKRVQREAVKNDIKSVVYGFCIVIAIVLITSIFKITNEGMCHGSFYDFFLIEIFPGIKVAVLFSLAVALILFLSRVTTPLVSKKYTSDSDIKLVPETVVIIMLLITFIGLIFGIWTFYNSICNS